MTISQVQKPMQKGQGTSPSATTHWQAAQPRFEPSVSASSSSKERQHRVVGKPPCLAASASLHSHTRGCSSALWYSGPFGQFGEVRQFPLKIKYTAFQKKKLNTKYDYQNTLQKQIRF